MSLRNPDRDLRDSLDAWLLYIGDLLPLWFSRPDLTQHQVVIRLTMGVLYALRDWWKHG